MTRNFNNGGTLVMTPPFRVSYPNVFEAKAFENGEPEFSVVMMFPEASDMKHLKIAAKKAAADKWGSKLPKKLRKPFRDGDTDETYSDKPECEGMTIVRAAMKEKFGQPGVVERDENGKTKPLTNPRDFYPGCWAIATINCYAYAHNANKGVTFGLQNLCKVPCPEGQDDSPLGNVVPDAQDDFGEFESDFNDDSDDGFGLDD
jgi:hypothetical protein